VENEFRPDLGGLLTNQEILSLIIYFSLYHV
jgi:hypothetical protein